MECMRGMVGVEEVCGTDQLDNPFSYQQLHPLTGVHTYRMCASERGVP